MSNRRSLVLITVDCLRADHVGFLGYRRPTTPFLDSLAEKSVMFSNAIVAGAPTYYSFPAIMASRYPLDMGRDVIGIAPGETTIATALRDSGYSTAAFLAGNPYLSPRFGYDTGFDIFHDFLDIETNPAESHDENTNGNKSNAASVSGGARSSAALSFRGFNQRVAKTFRRFAPLGAAYDELYFRYCQRSVSRSVSSFDSLRRFPSADVIVDQAIAWLNTISGRPFFLWLHFMDSHSPYYPRQEALHWLEDNTDAAQARYLNSYWNRDNLRPHRLLRQRKAVVALYDAGIRWMDSQTERLANELNRRGLWSTCLLALTADHGEEFLEHGGRYHSPSKLTEELIHVPLLLHAPDMGGANLRPEPFSLVHLAPTLLDALDIPVTASFKGKSFWKTKSADNEPAIVESVGRCTNPFEPAQRLSARILAIREAERKLVFDFACRQEYLFNLRSDPGEVKPLPAGTEPAVRRRLLERAREHVARSALSRDLARHLEAQLGEIRLGCDFLAGDMVA